jgi:hypothetical protein
VTFAIPIAHGVEPRPEKLGPVRGLDRIRYRKERLSRTSAVSICTLVIVKQVN